MSNSEIVIICGYNAAGKSTLVKALSAHYDCIVTDGKVTYKNKNLLEKSYIFFHNLTHTSFK